jgi:hypothetical protein
MSAPKHTSWIYITTEPRLWTVGHYGPSGAFHPESDHDSPEKAANRVAFLSGGLSAQAAPEMLEALKRAKIELGAYLIHGSCGSTSRVLATVEEAIAKAEGRGE